MPREITHPKLLFVEGKDEVNFFESLMEHMKVGKDVQIWDYEGKNKFHEQVRVLTKLSGFKKVERLGITRDADKSNQSAFQSVQGGLRKAGLPVPDERLVLVGENPAVVVMILPGGERTGMLEDLCLDSVADHKAMFCVDEYFTCLQNRALAPPLNMAKARLHAFLSAQDMRGKQLGHAAKKGYWPWDSPVFDEVKAFIGILAG